MGVAMLLAAVMNAVAAQLLGSQFGWSFIIVTLILMSFFGFCGWLGVVSWRRLSSAAKASQDTTAYEIGIRDFGVKFYLSFSIAFPLLMFGLALGDEADPSMYVVAVIAAFIVPVVAFPVSIWAGYVLGMVMVQAKR